LGLEARTDLPKVPYPTALDFFVFLSFAFIFATIIQVRELHFRCLVCIQTTGKNSPQRSMFEVNVAELTSISDSVQFFFFPSSLKVLEVKICRTIVFPFVFYGYR
jgi:hypothetical protein